MCRIATCVPPSLSPNSTAWALISAGLYRIRVSERLPDVLDSSLLERFNVTISQLCFLRTQGVYHKQYHNTTTNITIVSLESRKTFITIDHAISFPVQPVYDRCVPLTIMLGLGFVT